MTPYLKNATYPLVEINVRSIINNDNNNNNNNYNNNNNNNNNKRNWVWASLENNKTNYVECALPKPT